MSFKFLASLLAGAVACLSSFAQEAPANMKLFLLVGQSNMAGRGVVEEQDKQTNPKIFMLDKSNAWVLAKDPVHFDKPDIAGVGLCSQFARDVLKADSETAIGLIPCAMGGTSLEQWKPGDKLFKNAVARAKIALKNGKLEAILWHQGEADSSGEKAATYVERFASMIGAMRKELEAEKVPVLVGELGPYKPNFVKFNSLIAPLPSVVPDSVVVSSEGLTAKSDNLHFNSESLRTFGSRYAEAYFKLKAAEKK